MLYFIAGIILFFILIQLISMLNKSKKFKKLKLERFMLPEEAADLLKAQLKTRGCKKVASLLTYTQNLYTELNSSFETFEKNFNKLDKISSDVRWLYDNQNRIINDAFSVSEEIKRNREKLPACADGRIRAFFIAENFLQHNDGQIDAEALKLYLQAITKGNELTFGELAIFQLFLKINMLRVILDLAQAVLDIPNTIRCSVCIKNTVKALLMLPDLEMLEIASQVLPTEALLMDDPTGTYALSDKVTKAEYRRRIAEIARSARVSEYSVALMAYNLALEQDDRYYSNLGAYLFGEGFELLFDALTNFTYRPFKKSFAHSGTKLFSYILSVFAFAAVFLLPIILLYNYVSTTIFVLLIVFALAPVIAIAQSVINSIITNRIKPLYIARIDSEFCDDVKNKTVVVVPALLSSVKRAVEVLGQLEEHYLGNRFNNAVFLLLGDFGESQQENTEEDSEIIHALKEQCNALNEKYSTQAFAAVVRPRVYNEKNKRFAAWERKRGALLQLVRLIKGETQNFIYCAMAENILWGSKYILTADADTILPPGSLQKLIGCAAHPLNEPYLNKEKTRVERGYGLIQPRIGTLIPIKNRTTFARLFAPIVGIDTYSCAVSEVYQDYFNAGSFCGKGIFSIDAYYAVLNDSIKENTVLSHDLLEGELLRTGLAGDISLIDSYPANLLSYSSRLGRWTRGDWQLLDWIFSSKLSGISKWKLLNNLIRTLVVPSLLSLFIAGIFSGGVLSIIWLYVILAIFFPFILELFSLARQLYSSQYKKYTIKDLVPNLLTMLLRLWLSLLFLPYESYVLFKAMLLGVWRRFFSRRNVLQWVTAADAEKKEGLNGYIKAMLFSCIFGVLFYVLCVYKGNAFFMGFFIALLWIIAPMIAFTIGKLWQYEKVKLLPDEIDALKILSHRTLRFFTDSMIEENNFLPPDNFQEKPYKGYAHRTSPTNIGLGLTAIICGFKMSALAPNICLNMFEKTFDSIDKLEKWKGHLFNWYNTATCKPLGQKYVSSVDSGNFCACLHLCAAAINELSCKPILDQNARDSIGDAIASVLDGLDENLILHLSQYAENFYNAKTPKEGYDSLKLLLNDNTVLGVSKLNYAVMVARGWIDMYSQLSFSEELIMQLEDLEDINLRPLIEFLTAFPLSLDDTIEFNKDFNNKINDFVKVEVKGNINNFVLKIKQSFEQIFTSADNYKSRIDKMSQQLLSMAYNMDLSLLYDKKKKLFSIGFDVEQKQNSIHYYDLICSEARLTSYLAIAQGQVPPQHWFMLGRPFTRIGETPTAISWSGTMFEYLMPELFIESVQGSMLGITAEGAVKAQIAFGKINDIPWGISESAFCAYDFNKEYKYKAFGVPDIALSICAGEKVISPYSTMLALEIEPREAMNNIIKLVELGAAGKFGMYEAVDYSRTLSRSKNYSIVYSFMAHHQGMSLCALVNYLYNGAIRKTFENIEFIKAARTLLEERIPHGIPPRINLPLKDDARSVVENTHYRSIDNPLKDGPQVQVLDNGYMRGVYTASGSCGLYMGETAITMLEGCRITENGGSNIYFYDGTSGGIWNMGYLPMRNMGSKQAIEMHPDKCIFKREDNGILTSCSCSIAGEFNAEIRTVKLTNKASEAREIEVVLAHEICLMKQEDFLAHPAFNGLFIETELDKQYNSIIAKRRSRSNNEEAIAGLAVLGEGELLYETDRRNFFGRGNDNSMPQQIGAIMGKGLLGVPIQPILAAGKRVRLEANESTELIFITAAGPTVNDVIDTVRQCSLSNAVTRQLEIARSHAASQVKAYSLENMECRAAELLYSCALLRTRAAFNQISSGKEVLWRFGISGDIPLMLIVFDESGDSRLLERLLWIFDYVCNKGVKLELIILDKTISDYLDGEYKRIEGCIAKLGNDNKIYHIRTASITPNDSDSIYNCCCKVFNCSISLKDQLNQNVYMFNDEPMEIKASKYAPSKIKLEEGEFYNGIGSFINNGREYNIRLTGGSSSPSPWVNILCNNGFGCIVSENGGGYTWQGNSRQNKLTIWSNDAVTNRPSESIYIRDEMSGEYWSITNSPINLGDDYEAVHGIGYTRFRYNGFNLEQTQTVFVHKQLPLKMYLLNFVQTGEAARELSITFFSDAVLGVDINESYRHLYSGEIDGCSYVKRSDRGYMFLYMPKASYCNSKGSFLGRLGSIKKPASMRYLQLPCTQENDSEPCLAGRSKFKVNGSQAIACVLGYAETLEQISEYKTTIENAQMQQWLEETIAHWEGRVSNIQIKTPDRKLDILTNNWLLYQVLACRFISKTGFYQAGGAFGFRDQLQDCLALVYTEPELVREHILRCAQHQFPEGDVQHWWHPEREGVRTKMSDDLLFLPFVAVRYAEITGDWNIFNAKCNYIDGNALGDRNDLYENTTASENSDTLYKHCTKAIEYCLNRKGEHGLPLIGTGDWNDALDSVGDKGKGESIWLGWFQYTVISEFLKVCTKFDEKELADKYKQTAAELLENIEGYGWDGRWYRRAITDECNLLGSINSPECKIDAISQIWAVLSGGSRPERAEQAILSMETELLDRKIGILKLLSPPFYNTQPSPGYIQSYVPGVRENGGQYTHAAAWAVMAYAQMGRAQNAYEILSMLNPINHSLNAADANRYMVEPYVVTADIYSQKQHEGRGGWSWYTGAASQMYVAIVRDIAGLHFEGGFLSIQPCIPHHWSEYEVEYKYFDTLYSIQIKNPDNKSSGARLITLDGQTCENKFMLVNDGVNHKIRVVL